MNEQTKNLIEILKQAQRLGLSFDIGTAYIRRSYIDEQTELNQRIDAAIAQAETDAEPAPGGAK